MLSRVADSIYWMSRYIERAENVARFVYVNINLTLGTTAGTPEQWEPLIDALGDHEFFAECGYRPVKEDVIRFLTFDERNPNSILSCLAKARENARSVREVVSSEMWEQVNTFYLMVKAASSNENTLDLPHNFFTEVKEASHLFVGIADGTMSHGEAWHFSRLGRLLERADKTSRIVDVKYFILLPSVADVGTPLDDLQWMALLKSASALEMYRKRFGLISPRRIAEFLLLDREFPRAVRYCVGRAEDSLHVISGSAPGTYQNAAEQRLGRLRSELDYTSVDEIVGLGLHEFLDRFQTELNRAGDAVFETFFAMRPVRKTASQRG